MCNYIVIKASPDILDSRVIDFTYSQHPYFPSNSNLICVSLKRQILQFCILLQNLSLVFYNLLIFIAYHSAIVFHKQKQVWKWREIIFVRVFAPLLILMFILLSPLSLTSTPINPFSSQSPISQKQQRPSHRCRWPHPLTLSDGAGKPKKMSFSNPFNLIFFFLNLVSSKSHSNGLDLNFKFVHPH